MLKNIDKKNLKKFGVIVGISFIFLLSISVIFALTVLNDDSTENEAQEIDVPDEIAEDDLTNTQDDMEENETNEVEETVEPNIQSQNSYEEVVINGVSTGILVKNLSEYREYLSSSESCEGIDYNVYQASLSTELEGQDRLYTSISIINKDVVGEAEFNRFDQNYNQQKQTNFGRSIFNITCAGGANEYGIPVDFEFKTLLDDQFTRHYVGGYQYVPTPQEPVGYTNVIVSKDDTNIVSLTYSASKSDVLTFLDIENIQSCISVDGDFELIDTECATEKLTNDSDSLNLLIESAREELIDLVVFL